MNKKPNYDEKISEEMRIFEDLLRKEGLRITAQRILVAKTIFGMHTHFTADSLLEHLKDRRGEISKATIYRILSIMVSGNLLSEHNFGKDYKYYEHIVGHEHHDHIICEDCNRIVEFTSPEIETLQHQIAKSKGFDLTGHKLNLFAKCEKRESCEQKKKKNDSHI